mmetsp:Transcript_26787/g.86471  ORF Transcript_26787/g.86471 Transcript_26787/m.86471 type:complete len:247 (-) Transcript_26787:1618-2358(-)
MHPIQNLRDGAALDAHAKDVARLVLEPRVVGGAVVAVGECGQVGGVGQRPQQQRQRHGGEEAIKRHPGAILQLERLAARHGANGRDARVEPGVLLWQLAEDLLPDHARPVDRVPELGVRPPRRRVLAPDHVGEDVLELDGGHSFAHPDRIHLIGRVRPHLCIIRRHEGFGQLLAEAGVQPLPEVAGLRGRRLRLLLREVLDDTHHLGLGQPPEVGLHRVPNPHPAHACGRVALVVQPVLGRQHPVE